MGSDGIVPPEGVLDEADLLQGGTNELDGDRLDIDVPAVNYTPDTSPSEVDDANQLGARLKGIDNALAGVAGNVTMPVHNPTGGTFTKGSLLRATGFTSLDGGRTLVALADKGTVNGQAVAVAQADIGPSVSATALVAGELVDIDTSALTANKEAVLDAAGAIVDRPASGAAHTGIFQVVGTCTRKDGVNGRLAFNIAGPAAAEAGQFGALAGTGTPTDANRFVVSNDARVPTQGENDALVGTQGTPSTGNKYVTNQDPRLGPTLTATQTGDTTTTSLTDVLIAGMQITLGAGEDGDYLIEFSSSIENTNNGNTQEVVLYAGPAPTIVAESERRVENGAGQAAPVQCIARVNGLVATDTIEAHWRTSGNTATAHERVLVARRVG